MKITNINGLLKIIFLIHWDDGRLYIPNYTHRQQEMKQNNLSETLRWKKKKQNEYCIQI